MIPTTNRRIKDSLTREISNAGELRALSVAQNMTAGTK